MTPIWLHGAGMTGASWGSVEGLTPDLPGHGRAPRVSPPNVSQYARALAPDNKGDIALIGHSLGGMIALEMARHLGGRLRALVLLDTPLWLPCGPLLRFAPSLARLTARVPGPLGVAFVIARRTAPGSGRRLVAQNLRAMSRAGLRDAMLAAAGFNARQLLCDLTAPLLALWADRTFVTTRQMHTTLADRVPHASQRVLACGHMMHFDDRDRVLAPVQAFLERNR